MDLLPAKTTSKHLSGYVQVCFAANTNRLRLLLQQCTAHRTHENQSAREHDTCVSGGAATSTLLACSLPRCVRCTLACPDCLCCHAVACTGQLHGGSLGACCWPLRTCAAPGMCSVFIAATVLHASQVCDLQLYNTWADSNEIKIYLQEQTLQASRGPALCSVTLHQGSSSYPIHQTLLMAAVRW